MKQYGVLKPKSLDFLLAIMFSIVSVSALWIGIWISATASQALAVETLELMAHAYAGSFVEPHRWVVIVESVILYGAIFAFCGLSVFEIVRKKYKTIAGLFAMLLFTIAFALQLNFLVVYLLSAVSGLFSVFLIIFMACELYFAYLTVRLLYNMLVKQSAEYGKYKEEFAKEEAKAEPEAEAEEVEEEEPEAEPEAEEEAKAEEEDELDFIFTNSNEYRDYMYHDNVDKYMKQEEAKAEPKAEEPKAEEDEANRFGGAKGNNFTFEQKLKMAKPVVRKYFKEITAYFVSLGFTPALTKQAETFSYKNNKCASITTAGKNGLKVYFKLDVKDYEDSTIPVKYVGDVRKYEKTPLLFVAKSELAVKRAKKLMDDVKSKLN